MISGIYKILQNREIAKNTFEMKLEGSTEGICPGQFANILLPQKFLRRPISICDAQEGVLTLIYKVVGEGTQILSQMGKGQELDLLCGLGNGYDTSVSGASPLLIGGGAGIPPLFMLAKKLIGEGKRVTAILGFNEASEVFYKNEFEALGAKVIVTTADGSVGTKGFVTDAMEGTCASHIFSCGPLVMLKNVVEKAKCETQISLEERMGCGFGACMGCTHKTKSGSKRICKEGPVFFGKEIDFDEF